MPKRYETQSEAASDYRTLLSNIIKEIDAIDAGTPWSEAEPKWWIEMMDLQKSVREKLNAQASA